MTAAISGLKNRQHTFLQPTRSLNSSVLDLSKQFFDHLLRDISSTQDAQRVLERRNKKRKRNDFEESKEMLRMQQLYMDGFEVEQIWQQARRVLDATLDEVQKETHGLEEPVDGEERNKKAPGKRAKTVHFQEVDGNEDSEIESLGEEGVDWEYEGDDVMADDQNEHDHNNKEAGPELSSEEESPDIGDDTPDSDLSDSDNRQEELVKDAHGLNDGFFSIDQFNKHSQAMENVDFRGDNDDGAASDEEDIDWEADPLAQGAVISLGKPSKAAQTSIGEEHDEDEDANDDEEGPTFADADLDAPFSDEDDDGDPDAAIDDDPLGDFSNTNDIMYKDFFAPPAKAKDRLVGRSKRGAGDSMLRFPGQRQRDTLATESGDNQGRDDIDMDRAISSVRRDLEDEDNHLDENDEADTSVDRADLSTHERRMLDFRKEIARLERENVASKPWALTGETVAPARPENALLEEDLDFERAGKPLPVITQEINESIEALIKRRIVNSDFDEVRRRRPELENLKGSTRRGMLDAHGRREELSDTKPQRGLGEEYEDEYLRQTDANYLDQRSEATNKKHAEIEKQWAEIRTSLDALCNWHYKPRPSEKNLEVRTNTAVVNMEDARPAAEAGGNASGLAPQEVYKPGQDGKVSGEVRTKGGTAVSKEEDSRESKRRRRRRNKEKAQKARGNVDPEPSQSREPDGQKPSKAKKRDDRDDVVKTLKKGNVQFIGKKGELQDVEGKASSTNAHGGRTGVAGYML